MTTVFTPAITTPVVRSRASLPSAKHLCFAPRKIPLPPLSVSDYPSKQDGINERENNDDPDPEEYRIRP